MTWSTPKTWVTGEVVRASTFNQEIRDNLTAKENNYALSLWRSAAFSNPTAGVWFAYEWDGLGWNVGPLLESSGSKVYFRAGSLGTYLLVAQLETSGTWVVVNPAVAYLALRVNGSTEIARQTSWAQSGGSRYPQIVASCVWRPAEDDYLEMMFYTDSGTISGYLLEGLGTTQLHVQRIGD